MPAVKVKKRSSMDCVGENLCSCQKYCKTSKRSCLQVKTSQQEAILLDSTQDSIEVPSNMGRSDLVVDKTEANNCHVIFSGASTQLPKLPTPPSCDPMSEGRTTTIPAEPQCILETIFSPILKPDDAEFKSINQTIPAREVENAELPLLVADDSDDGSCSSSELQICNVSDFYICENADSLTFDGDLAFTDIMNATCAEYEPMNTEMMLEASERYMILPFLEKTLETSNINNVDYTEESVMNTDDAFLYLAIHQIKSSDQETEMTYHPHDLSETECFDPQLIFRNLPDLPETVSSFRPLLLPKENWKRKSITLVLDLDETLVHSTLEHCEDADFSFLVFFNMKEHMVYVKRRPYLQMFLETVAGMFEIVIFTASQSTYAEQLLDILDPDKKLIGQRIYRESCIFSDGSYTKDLTVLGVDLAKVAIIDNSPQVFRLQVNNGIPIKSWFDDPADNALISLLPFLETLADAEDVRPLIAKRFGNKE